MRMDHLSPAISRFAPSSDEARGPDRKNRACRGEDSQPDRQIRTGGHIPKLDSLRGVAILLVVTYHTYGGSIDYRNWSGLPRYFLYVSRYGYTGVELFFVLSGFLITNILLSTKHDTDFYDKFYKRRALRILPAYLAMLIIVKIWLGVTWKYILACLLYIANMAGIVGARTSEYAPLWSLAVEEQFYLLWPFCVRRLSPRTLLRLAIGICLSMPVLRLTAATISPRIDIRYKTYFIADYLAYGAMIAIAIHLGSIHAGNIRRIAQWFMAAGSLVATIVLYAGYESNHFARLELLVRSMSVLPFVWIYCGLVLRAIDSYDSGNLQSNKLLEFFGYISYGLYLVHEFIFYEYGKMVNGTRLAAMNTSFAIATIRYVVAGGIAILLAYLSRRFYEEYFLRMGRRKKEVALRASPIH